MKTSLKASWTFVLILFGALASATAMAQHHGHRHGYGGGVRLGISLGFPIYGPGYYPASYYAYPAPVYTYPARIYAYPAPAYSYPGAVIGLSSPPVYVEQSVARTAPAPSQAQGDWYYCPASKSYYPYINECPSGWQRVPALPPSR